MFIINLRYGFAASTPVRFSFILSLNLIFKIPEVVEFLRFFQSLVIRIMILHMHEYSFRYKILLICVLPLFLKIHTTVNFWYLNQSNDTDAIT